MERFGLQLASRLCLYIDGQPFPELTPVRLYWQSEDDINVDDATKLADLSKNLDATGCPRRIVFRFKLARPDAASGTPESLSRWDALTTRLYEKIDAPHDVSVGFAPTPHGGFLYYLPSAVSPDQAKTSNEKQETLDMLPFSKTGMTIAAGVLLVLVGLFFRMGARTDMLRDSSLPVNPGGRYPFSLGLCQMALWTVLVIGSYVFINFCTGDYNRFSSTALALLGISSATGLGAALVNGAVGNRSRTSLTSAELMIADRAALTKLLQTAQAELEQALQTSPINQTTIDTLTERLSDLQARVDYLRYPPFKFFYDLLRERNNINFHRLQLICWTIVLAVIFVKTVICKLAMPTFDPAILILAGISSGTYVGFKFPESQSK